jgi:hypothetical protein
MTVGGRLAQVIGDRLGWGAHGDVGAYVLVPGSWWAQVQPVVGSDHPGAAWRVVLVSPAGRVASRARVNTAMVAIRVAEDMVRRRLARDAGMTETFANANSRDAWHDADHSL